MKKYELTQYELVKVRVDHSPPWSGVRPSVRPSTISNVSPLKPFGRSKPKFYVEPPLAGGTKVCLRHLGHMTKMAATPIYG